MVFVKGVSTHFGASDSEANNLFSEISFDSSQSQSISPAIEKCSSDKTTTTTTTTLTEEQNQQISTMTESLPKLPGEGNSFTDMHKYGKIYVDKTAFIEKLFITMEDTIYLFFTRPRGFGKTTFLEILEEFFLGNKPLFENTSVFKRGNTEKANGTWLRYPVISLKALV